MITLTFSEYLGILLALAVAFIIVAIVSRKLYLMGYKDGHVAGFNDGVLYQQILSQGEEIIND